MDSPIDWQWIFCPICYFHLSRRDSSEFSTDSMPNMWKNPFHTVYTITVATQDSLFVAMVNIVCGHVRQLKVRLRHLGEDDGDNSKFYKDLMDCCKRYEECLRWETQLSSWRAHTHCLYLQLCRAHWPGGIDCVLRAIRSQRNCALLHHVSSVCCMFNVHSYFIHLHVGVRV